MMIGKEPHEKTIYRCRVVVSVFLLVQRGVLLKDFVNSSNVSLFLVLKADFDSVNRVRRLKKSSFGERRK